MNDFGILLFGHTRPLFIADVLESLKRQSALEHVHVWLDGDQGNPDVLRKTQLVADVVSNFSVAEVNRHRGALGFRKLVLQALCDAVEKFRYIMVLEDDCFPTRDAVATFKNELRVIEDDESIFSVYGHHFLVPAEGEVITRFQGWGWGTTSKKLRPFLDKLIDCYSLTEKRYLEFVNRVLTDEIRQRLDVTPPRLPSETLTRFFAWDETLALLTALDGLGHKKTPTRTIYNFGASEDSSRFKNAEWYAQPPFNMIAHVDAWKYF
jgi:hypothetical protein